jgi:DNA-binding IclR family transcriptional regulator
MFRQQLPDGGSLRMLGAMTTDARPKTADAPPGAQAVTRALRLLHCFRDNAGELSASQLARRMDLSVSTAHRLARTLVAAGFLEQDAHTARYRLGPSVAELGQLSLHQRGMHLAEPELDALARATGTTADLAIRSGDHAVILVGSSVNPTAGLGLRRPLHSTALGKVLSAYDPVAHSEAIEAGRKAFTERTVCDLDDFEHLLDMTRARGYAADVEETWEGVASVAAPIHDRRRMPVGAVGITGAVERLCREGELRPELIAAVRDCARAVSRDLGAGRF